MELQPQASLVINDSEWNKVETTFPGTPCLTVRGTLKACCCCGPDQYASQRGNMDLLKKEAKKILAYKSKRANIPPLWDGKTGERFAAILAADRH
jgi:UDP-N-acetylglucosamine 2-epimerase (non-hydrolysing)